MIRRISDTGGPRLVIIGLDGAGFNHLDPILRSGEVPGFIRLFESGAASDCISTIPPLTPPAWSTLLTGVNPGKHGVFDFIQPDESGAFRMVDARFRRRKTFIDHARESEIRAVSLLVPYTFPPDPQTTGLMISGLGTPSAESDFIRPHSFRDVLLADFPFLREVDPTKDQTLETLHHRLIENTTSLVDLARRAMRDLPDWGILFAVFQATDLVPHFFSRFFDPAHPDFQPDGPDVPDDFRESLRRVYRAIDPFVGECLDAVGREGGWVILVSDHGSEPLMGAIGKDAFLARWLEERGYLATTGEKGRVRRAALAEMGSVANRLLYLARRYTPHGVRNAVNVLLGRRKEDITSRLTAIPFMEDIVWERTRAFCAPGGYGVGLYINREGDFPHGIVPKGAEYYRLRDEIRSQLESLQIAPGVPLFNRVLSRDDALWGPAVGLAPDLLLMWREDRRLRDNDFRLVAPPSGAQRSLEVFQLVDASLLDRPEVKPGSGLTWCGTHRMEGLFGVAGDGVRAGVRLTDAPSLADVLPTIHMLAGLPIPADVDGKIITEAFERDFLDTHKPVGGPPEDSAGGPTGTVSADESEKMIELLQGLGYLH